jgi:hypothetical protein
VKKSIFVVLGIGLLCMTYFALKRAAPTRSLENIVLSQTGRYLSPQGSQVVDVSLNKDGKLKIDMKSLSCGNGSLTTFQSNSDWFMCFDATDRLWLYHPDDPKYCHCWYTNERGSGILRPGEVGGWQGIPDAFLARLPAAAKVTYTMAQTAQEFPAKR